MDTRPVITDDQRFARRPDFVYRLVAGQAVLVPVRSGAADLQSIFTLNEVGSEVWERISPEHTVAEIVTAVTEEFEVDREVATKDVTEFLQRLLSVGVIEPAAEDALADGV